MNYLDIFINESQEEVNIFGKEAVVSLFLYELFSRIGIAPLHEGANKKDAEIRNQLICHNNRAYDMVVECQKFHVKFTNEIRERAQKFVFRLIAEMDRERQNTLSSLCKELKSNG